jgi:hypothetical protein
VSVWFGDRWRCSARPDRPWQGGNLPTASMVLVPWSIRVPPDLLERLRIGAPQLGLCQGEITAAALDRFLTDCGF